MEVSVGEATFKSSKSEEISSEQQQLSWGPFVLTQENVQRAWIKLQEFPVIFDDFNKNNIQNFYDKLLDPHNIILDIGPGVGIAAGFMVRPGLDMVLHIVMFDKRIKGREPLCREMMKYFFDKLQLRRMSAIITEDARTAVKLALRLGFTLEGTIRKGVLRNGEFLDAYMYGILKEEFYATVA
jgi:hypothetical protein